MLNGTSPSVEEVPLNESEPPLEGEEISPMEAESNPSGQDGEGEEGLTLSSSEENRPLDCISDSEEEADSPKN